MYNIELVRQICRDINNAKDDSEKEEELLSLLQAVIKENQEEVRIRMAFITRKYAVSSAMQMRRTNAAFVLISRNEQCGRF